MARRLNAGQIIDAALEDIAESTSSGFIRPATSLRWLNEAQEEMCSFLAEQGPKGLSTINSIVAGQQEYPLPATTTFLLAVWWYDGTDWKRLAYTPYQLQSSYHDDDEGTDPSQYYIRRNLIGLIPVPSASGSDLLKIDDVSAPPEITSRSDYPFGGHEIFQKFNPALQNYIAFKAYAKAQNWSVADRWYALFEKAKVDAKRLLRMRITDPMARGFNSYGPRAPFDLVDNDAVIPAGTIVPDYVP